MWAWDGYKCNLQEEEEGLGFHVQLQFVEEESAALLLESTKSAANATAALRILAALAALLAAEVVDVQQPGEKQQPTTDEQARAIPDEHGDTDHSIHSSLELSLIHI